MCYTGVALFFFNIAHLFAGSPIKLLDSAKSALHTRTQSAVQVWLRSQLAVLFCSLHFAAHLNGRICIAKGKAPVLEHADLFILINTRLNRIRSVKLQTGLWNGFISPFLHCEIWIAHSCSLTRLLLFSLHNHSAYKSILFFTTCICVSRCSNWQTKQQSLFLSPTSLSRPLFLPQSLPLSLFHQHAKCLVSPSVTQGGRWLAALDFSS